MTLRCIVFDVGETLIDETRQWGEWADWLGVPRLGFFAALGAVIDRGEHHREVFQLLRPGFDAKSALQQRKAAGRAYRHGVTDLYPDARPCLERLRGAGFRVGIAGNQPAEAEQELRDLGLAADFIGSSGGWEVEKPAPAFFRKVAESAGFPPREIAYVGDHLQNDVLPARAAGFRTLLLRRGPWGYLHAGRPEAAQADLVLQDLSGLPEVLERL